MFSVLSLGSCGLRIEEDGLHQLRGYHIWIHARGRTAILNVSSLLVCGRKRDADRGSSVGNAVAELVDRGGLVPTRQAPLVTLAIDAYVFHVLLLQLTHGLDDGIPTLATFLVELLDAEVGVTSCTVPVALHRFGVKVHLDAERFGDSVHQEARYPKLITCIDAHYRTDLVFPLSSHHFSINARNLNACIQARVIVTFGNITAKSILHTGGAIVGSLRSWETRGRPSKGPCGEVVLGLQESIFLFNTEPRLLLLHDGLHDLIAEESEVGIGWHELREILIFPGPGVAQHNNIVTLAEGVTEESNGLHDDL